MPGKVKVGGTNYSIKSGKTKVNGTNYTIKGGKTKVSGTNYTITLSSGVSVSISGAKSPYTYAFLSGGSKTDGTYTIEEGADVKVYVSSNNTSYDSTCRVYLNGSGVKAGAGYYTFSSTGYKTIKIVFTEYTAGTSSLYYHCNITTT